MKKDESEEEEGKGGEVLLEHLARLMKKDESEEEGGELSPEHPPKVAVVMKKDKIEEEGGKVGKVSVKYLARMMKPDESEEEGEGLSSRKVKRKTHITVFDVFLS